MQLPTLLFDQDIECAIVITSLSQGSLYVTFWQLWQGMEQRLLDGRMQQQRSFTVLDIKQLLRHLFCLDQCLSRHDAEASSLVDMEKVLLDEMTVAAMQIPVIKHHFIDPSF